LSCWSGAFGCALSVAECLYWFLLFFSSDIRLSLVSFELVFVLVLMVHQWFSAPVCVDHPFIFSLGLLVLVTVRDISKIYKLGNM
jgi:hypothetical protein